MAIILGRPRLQGGTASRAHVSPRRKMALPRRRRRGSTTLAASLRRRLVSVAIEIGFVLAHEGGAI